MRFRLQRAAVIGAGAMGAAIAAHLANAGVPVDLLDIAPDALTAEETRRGLTLDHPAVRNRIVNGGFDRAKNAKPAAFMSQSAQSLIRVGNLATDFERLRDANWIIEAVVENLDVKRELMARVESIADSATIITTNTSGIPINAIAAGRGDAFRRRFLGAHFFNPPRYLKLLEVIPTADTDPEVVATVAALGSETLGKGVVICRDTPNFIGNRLMSINGSRAMAHILANGYTVEEVDAVTGPLIGRPKTATFRLLDVVGIDVAAIVRRNLYPVIPDDPDREVLRHPRVEALDQAILDRGWLGNKTGQGFYKETRSSGGREFWALDLATFEHRPPQAVESPTIKAAERIADLGERLRFLIGQHDRIGDLVWAVTGPALAYAARCAPVVAEHFTALDQASRWGFAHELGPFEIWDALGVADTVARLKGEGEAIPTWVDEMLAAGCPTFYQRDGARVVGVYDPAKRAYAPLVADPKALVLRDRKATGHTVKSGASASLVDLGDGVLGLEFHAKMNALDASITELIVAGAREAEQNWQALVVGNQGENFSAGANLFVVASAAQAGQFDAIDKAVGDLQSALMALRFCRVPVVAAPFGLTLGGGAEVAMAAARICAHAELYMGQVEVGVGLIPAAGGCKELLRRVVSPVARAGGDTLAALDKLLRAIGTAQTSASAAEARDLGFLTSSDRIVMNRDHLLAEAKSMALTLATTYAPPARELSVYAAGRGALAALRVMIYTMQQAGYASAHDAMIANRLAYVLCGGDLSEPTWVDEQYILDLERAAFVDLCREPKSVERMWAMLKSGRPLRN